jgi:hypothetical protein
VFGASLPITGKMLHFAVRLLLGVPLGDIVPVYVVIMSDEVVTMHADARAR